VYTKGTGTFDLHLTRKLIHIGEHQHKVPARQHKCCVVYKHLLGDARVPDACCLAVPDGNPQEEPQGMVVAVAAVPQGLSGVGPGRVDLGILVAFLCAVVYDRDACNSTKQESAACFVVR
jgi:hypothetical protein